MGRMKDSQIYLRAAELCAIKHEVGSNNPDAGCCDFICSAGGARGWALVDNEFEPLFKPEHTSRPLYWFGSLGPAENNKARVLALCFMAAIAESEGR